MTKVKGRVSTHLLAGVIYKYTHFTSKLYCYFEREIVLKFPERVCGILNKFLSGTPNFFVFQFFVSRPNGYAPTVRNREILLDQRNVLMRPQQYFG